MIQLANSIHIARLPQQWTPYFFFSLVRLYGNAQGQQTFSITKVVTTLQIWRNWAWPRKVPTCTNLNLIVSNNVQVISSQHFIRGTNVTVARMPAYWQNYNHLALAQSHVQVGHIKLVVGPPPWKSMWMLPSPFPRVLLHRRHLKLPVSHLCLHLHQNRVVRKQQQAHHRRHQHPQHHP